MPHDHHGHAHETTGGSQGGRAWVVALLFVILVAGSIIWLSPKPPAPSAPVPVPTRAVVTKVLQQEDLAQGIQAHQRIEVKALGGAHAGATSQIDIGGMELATSHSFAKVGDVVYIGENSPDTPSDPRPFVQDFDRSRAVLLIALVLAGVTLAVSRARGLRALIGLCFSLVVIGFYIMPSLVAGGNLLVTAMIGSLLILGPTYFFSYGFTRKTAVALVSTLLALLLALGLGVLFADLMHMTGLQDEDAVNFALANGKDGAFVFQLLMAGMIIGVLGVLDDVVIAQVSTVAELAAADPGLSRLELFRRTMRVGNDHIASVVNTLVLAYAGASLPVFLYFSTAHLPLGVVISDEHVAAEILRTVVGTICLVLAVPLATALASFAYRKK